MYHVIIFPKITTVVLMLTLLALAVSVKCPLKAYTTLTDQSRFLLLEYVSSNI